MNEMAPDINSLSLGDTIKAPIVCIDEPPSQEGKVVYIHPQKRFFTLEFNNKIRESYCAYGPMKGELKC